MKSILLALTLFTCSVFAQSFSGIGASLASEGDYLKVGQIFPGGPASASTLKAGDVILAVGQGDAEAVSLEGKPLSEAVGLIKGPIGSTVALTIKRGDTEPQIISIVRNTIKMPAAPARAGMPKVGDVMDLRFKDLDGKDVDLAAMKGKVVLVDFWATWCGPCIRELPNVKRVYEAKNKDGFEVIGISLDKNEASLRAFMKRSEMPWPQYFDGKGWGNTLAGKFGIRSIPATFLIGKDGTVVASNLRGTGLDEAVDAAFTAE